MPRSAPVSDAPIAASPGRIMKWRLGAGTHVRPRPQRLTPAAIEEKLRDANYTTKFYQCYCRRCVHVRMKKSRGVYCNLHNGPVALGGTCDEQEPVIEEEEGQP